MIRRKNYRSSHSLELGNHGDYYSQSLPVRKLTSMKVIKYLILILIGVLIHTAYRAIFYTGEDAIAETRAKINEAENLPADQVNQEIKVEKSEQGDKIQDVNPDNKNNEKRGENIDEARGESRVEYKKEEEDKAKNKPEEIPQNKEIVDNIDVKQESIDKKKEHVRESLAEIVKEEKVGNKVEQVENKVEQFENKVDQVENKVEQVVKMENKNDLGEQEKHNIQNREEILQDVIHENRDNIARNPHRIKDPVPLEFQELMEKVQKLKSPKLNPESHGLPTLITYGTSDNYEFVKQLVISVQDFLPNTKIYIYDLSLEDWQKNMLKAGCHVRVKESEIFIFPKFISSLKNFHWRPVLLQIALGQFRHIMWIEPGVRIKSASIKDLMQSVSKVMVIGQKAMYTTNAVTNFRMYKYLPTNRKKIQLSLHIEPKALIIHNEDWVFENFLRAYVACALEEKCQAPLGAEDNCVFDVTGTKYAACHKYDESSLNIILKNYFDFDISKFYVPSVSYFTKYDKYFEQGMKMCRNPEDVKNL